MDKEQATGGVLFLRREKMDSDSGGVVSMLRQEIK